MTLNTQTQTRRITKKSPAQINAIAARMRKNFATSQANLVREALPVQAAVEYIIPLTAGNTRVLTYRAGADTAPMPVYINMHGGGFIMGSPEDDDFWCRRIANSLTCLIVNIDYYLAPEHKFPTALEQCYEVIQWLVKHARELAIDPARIAVGGQSAGANLAAALCLLARARQEFRFIYQVLLYPPLDMSTDPYRKPATDTILTAHMLELFNDCYFRTDADALQPLVSPLLADNVAGLPDALIIAAEHDPLRPEAECYAQRLTAAGNNVELQIFAGCMHAFTHYGPEAAATAAAQLVANRLQTAFRKPL